MHRILLRQSCRGLEDSLRKGDLGGVLSGRDFLLADPPLTPIKSASTRARSTRYALWFVGILVIGAVTWHHGFPAIPSSLSPKIEKALSGAEAKCYSYPLGGFVDRQMLWRIDGSPEAVAAVVDALKLKESRTVPSAFWKMRPYYWPREMPENARPCRSDSFEDADRGPDGLHYFLLHDTRRGRAYVWVKDNF